LPGVPEDLFAVVLLHVKDQQMFVGTMTVHQQQYHNNQDSLVPVCWICLGKTVDYFFLRKKAN